MTMIAPLTADGLATAAIDDMLRLCTRIRTERHRDPLRALEDVLLGMRSGQTKTCPTTAPH